MYFFGVGANRNSGTKRYDFPDGLELVSMMLDYHEHTQDKHLLREAVLPIAEAAIAFHDKHYERGPDGKIRFNPAQALDNLYQVLTPLPEIAGLRWLSNAMLSQKLPLSKTATGRAKRMQRPIPGLKWTARRFCGRQTGLSAT